jgi:hypothetical protein
VLFERGEGELEGEEGGEVTDGFVFQPVFPDSVDVAFFFVAFHGGDEGGGLVIFG